MQKRNTESVVNVMAVAIHQGLIQLIEPDGTIAIYRQRGIGSLSDMALIAAVREGKLSSDYVRFKELPRNYRIYFEDETIMGRAQATFPNLERYKKLYGAR